MTKDNSIEQLRKEFSGKATFTRKELFDFYLRYDPDLKENTFRWRIYNLKESQLISSISRVLFSLTYKPLYKPDVDNELKRLAVMVRKQFPSMKFAFWQTRALYEFMLHQPGRSITILEVEKNAVELVFHHLKDEGKKSVYLRPNLREMELYIKEEKAAIVVVSLISKAPVQVVSGTPTVALEKMIVDMFSDRDLFGTFQGTELINIVNTAYHRYQLDLTKLSSYAKRRRKDEALKQYLIHFTDIPRNLLDNRS